MGLRAVVAFLPPSVLHFVPPEAPAHFIRELVRESLDLSEICFARQVGGESEFERCA